MYTLRYRLSLNLGLPHEVVINGYPTYDVLLLDINFHDLYENEIDKLDGQYDWIDAWCDSEHDKIYNGFNSSDVMMECEYKNGNYIITLVSDKPWDTIVHQSQGYRECDLTLKEAVKDFLDGCISDGIGENEIGWLTYEHQQCDVWMVELTEIGDE